MGEYNIFYMDEDFLKQRYIRIPYSIVTNTELTLKRVLVTSYFLIHKSEFLNTVTCSIDMILDYFELKNTSRSSKCYKDVLEIILYLIYNDYIHFDVAQYKSIENINRKELVTYYVNLKRFNVEESYSIIHIDEYVKILNYNNCDLPDYKETLLTVLAYLRHKIPLNVNDSYRYIEAYNEQLKSIASTLGKHIYRRLHGIFDILKELGIIYYYVPSRRLTKNETWLNYGFIFANMYKRQWKKIKGEYTLVEVASDEEYYMQEILKKEKQLIKYFKCKT